MGEILLDTEYTPGATMNLEFTLTIFSPDFDWGKYCEIVFPPEFVPQSASNFPGLFPSPGYEIAAQIDGQKVFWDAPLNNYFYSSDVPEEIDFTVDLISSEVERLRELSPLWEMSQQGIDLKTIEWSQSH